MPDYKAADFGIEFLTEKQAFPKGQRPAEKVLEWLSDSENKETFAQALRDNPWRPQKRMESRPDSTGIYKDNLRGSKAGTALTCGRQLAYNLLGTKDEPDGRAQMVFDQGHFIHHYFQTLLPLANVQLEDCEEEHRLKIKDLNNGNGISMHIDGRLVVGDDAYLWECKTVSKFEFARWEAKPARRGKNGREYKATLASPSISYVAQANLYAFAVGVEWVCLWGVEKDSMAPRVLVFKRNKALAQEVSKKYVEAYLTAKSKKNTMPRGFEVNERGYLPWQCGYCSAGWGTCWMNAGAEAVNTGGKDVKVAEPNAPIPEEDESEFLWL